MADWATIGAMRRRIRLRKEVLIRVAADALMVAACYLLAFVVRFLLAVAFASEGTFLAGPAQFRAYLDIYARTVWVLVALSLAVCTGSGFYTFGRAYRGRYKMLVVAQAVSLGYLVFGFCAYFMRLSPAIPRAVWAMGWAFTLAALAAARLWAGLWRAVMHAERRLLRDTDQQAPIKDVLVIGGAGYIGSMLCRQLLDDGYGVRVLDALIYGDASLEELRDDPRFELVKGDSRDVSDVFRAMLDMDAVVHLGELVGDPACELDERLTLEINLAATRMVAEAAKGCGVRRFIYASSCSVYGAGEEVLDERSSLRPVSLYARAKIASERSLLALNGPRFNPVILRFATVYGLSYRPRFDLVINLLTAKAVCDGEITIFGGDQWRPFVHVADVGRAIRRCLEAPLDNVNGQIFNVGSDEQNYTIDQIGELIYGVIPQAKVVHRGDDVDKRNYHVSFAKVRRELGFEAAHTVQDGVRELATALRAGAIEDYRLACYSNYKTLSDRSNHLDIRTQHIPGLYAPQPAAAFVEAARAGD